MSAPRRENPARLAALAALLVSGAAHGLVLAGFGDPVASAPSGGSSPVTEMPLLGNDFADLAAGIAVPVAPQPVTPVPAQSPERAPAEVAEPVQPTTAEMALPMPAQARHVPADPLPPVAERAPGQSPRPPARLDPARPPAPPPAGNAPKAARRGDAYGESQGKAQAAQGSAETSAPPAAARVTPAQYGAAIIRKIRATPSRAASGRGTALVGFEIGGSGALRSVRILRSSGSAALDALALDHVRRAAPFPPPPDGAARFSFEFVARG